MGGNELYFKRNFHSMVQILQTKNALLALLLLIPTAHCLSQTAYPADSILSSSESTLLERAVVAPIAVWQRLSYRTSFLNCQFHPSCSNYAALSISRHGVLAGSALAADRIIRCNPAALHYQLKQSGLTGSPSDGFHHDGRLENPVPDNLFVIATEDGKSPLLAAGMSAMLPGAGRIYSGRFWDGLFGFITVGILANATYMNINMGNKWGTTFSAAAMLIFYCGEIIGAYRAAARTVP